MVDREKVIKELEDSLENLGCGYMDGVGKLYAVSGENLQNAIALLKEQEAVEPKTIPEELKLKMWNAFYAKEDKFEEKYVGTKEHNSWFLIYRPWLQVGFNLAIDVIADWEGQ